MLASFSYAEPSTFTLLERILVALLIIGSVAGFWARFGRVVRTIRAAKPDPGFSLAPMGKRIWDFVWEVVLQARVIRERPLPGIAHALLFWGFCTFAIVTVNHFATAFGASLLHSDSLYHVLAIAFGVLVAVAIAGLFVRRFLVRPVWLGQQVSVQSGFIAFLIFTLMGTYLGAFFTTPEEPATRALWWIHTLALLVFLPLIPHTKHLHLVLSPATVFLSRGAFSAIPPLAGDEDFGLVTGKDVTRLIALQSYSCVECGRCTEHCPAANTGKALNPKEIILGMRGYLNGPGVSSEEPLLGRYNSQVAAFQCTTCGSCEYHCPVGIEHLPVIVGLRRGAVNTGAWEDDYGTKLFLALERSGNALGLNASERDKFIQKQALPIFDGSQEYCLWLGCMGSYDPQGREIAVSLAKVMKHLGVSFGVLRKEKCTGDAARRLGNDLVFQQLAEQNLESFKQPKVARMVSICPHCVRTISTDYREFGAPPAIEHHTEFLSRMRKGLPSTNSKSIAYHDPCYLGRYRDIYDEPRTLAAQFGDVREPARSRGRSFCCGAGGGLAFLGEETGTRVSHVRAKELIATGATVVGAACPFCNTMFRDALTAVSPNPPRLLDIAQIAAMALEEVRPPQAGVIANEDNRSHKTSSAT